VVEDDTFILMDLEAVIVDAGAEVVGLCRSVGEALSTLDTTRVDVAILDFGVSDGTVAELAHRLTANGTPFCFYTGQVATDPRLAAWHAPKIIQKPAQPRAIVDTLATLAGR